MTEGRELEFVDTNVFIYAFDRSSLEKRGLASNLLRRLGADRRGCVSVQVLQEFYAGATKVGLSRAEALEQVELLARWRVHRPAPADVVAAIHLQQQHSVSIWDALIVQSAVQLGCGVLWSEDLQHGRTWGGLTVRNPFVLE